MWRQAGLLVVGTAVIAAVAARVLSSAREAGHVPWSTQVLVGLLCAVVGALVVVTANADGVPDDLEGPLGAVTVAALAALAWSTLRRQGARRRGQRGQRRSAAPSSVRSPGAPREATSRMHSGP